MAIAELDFGLGVEDTMLRLIDGRTRRLVPSRAEAVDAERERADTAQLRAAAEQQRADALQSEVVRLSALLRRYEDGSGA